MRRITCLAALLAGACVTVPVEPGDPSGIEFGLFAVRKTGPENGPKAVVVSRLGGWASASGAGLGYARTKHVELNEECRVVFLIENDQQLARSIELVNSSLDTSEGDICVSG